MRISLDQVNLASAIQTVSRAVSARSTMPVLQGILIAAQNGRVAFKAYDTEIGIESPATGAIEREGGIVLPAKIVGEIVRSIPSGTIVLDADPSNFTATLTWGRSEFTIHGLDATQFPEIPDLPGSSGIEIDVETFKSLIRQTTFATAQGDARPVLTGVLMETSGRELGMVAIDGIRLAVRRAYLSDDGTKEQKAIVPARALNEVLRLIQAGTDRVILKIGQGQASFGIGETTVTTRLIEGQFPAYQQIVPKSYVSTTTVRRQDLHDACERAELIASDQDHTIHLDLSGERISVSAASPDVGKVREDVDAHVEGDGMEIAFNARLIIEGLRAMDSEEVLLRTTGRFSPSSIRSVEHENFIYVVMPLRTAEVS